MLAWETGNKLYCTVLYCTVLYCTAGNELYYPSYSWTLGVARHIKQGLGAGQLVMDGRIISRTGFYPELADTQMAEVL